MGWGRPVSMEAFVDLTTSLWPCGLLLKSVILMINVCFFKGSEFSLRGCEQIGSSLSRSG